MKKPGQSWKIREDEADLRLDKWLAVAERLGSRSRALEAIAKGKVFVNETEQTTRDAAHKLRPGETVRLWLDRPGSAQRRYSERHSTGLHLLYEDASILVLNKPAGLLSVPLPSQPEQDSLLDQLKIHLRSHRHVEPLVVHRIDRDTSGLVLFAKTHDAQRKLKEQFQRRQATRIYLALVYGCPKPDRGAWRDSLVWDRPELKPSQPRTAPHAAKEALCRYQVLENFPQAALIEVSLVSGKRNQIRIQASLRGHPLVGEKIYLYENAPPRSIEFPRQALHAHRLAFKHPVDGREMKFEAPPPEDFQKLLRKLR